METLRDTLETALPQFTGTERYYRHFGGVVYTDGIKYLAEKAKAFWLIDLIASYQAKYKEMPFQVWKLKVNQDNQSAVATMREDTGRPEMVRQEIEYTDFPLPEIELYCIRRILLLPSEY